MMICTLFFSSLELYLFFLSCDDGTGTLTPSQSSAIFKTAKNKELIKVMSDDEHEKWLLQATKYKVKMLRLVTKLVKEWEPTE